MREARTAQLSIFDFYAKHEFGDRLQTLSELLDDRTTILPLIEQSLRRHDIARTGACGLSVESIFRCLLLKQILGVSYEKLAFHLSDSPTYRRFARLSRDQAPSRSGLQSTIRRIAPETLQAVNQLLMSDWVGERRLSVASLRIDSTVVVSNIAPPSDSQLLADGVRVLSRLMAQSKKATGIRLRFTDQRKRSKSLSFRIFNAKKPEKDRLYAQLLSCARVTLQQSHKAIDRVRHTNGDSVNIKMWINKLEHYRALLLRVIDQTQRRVYGGETVPAAEKVVSLFEAHTDIIVKGLRDVQYGHKINLATQADGFITYLTIEHGNPSDANLYLPVLHACRNEYGRMPNAVVADGCYASQDNARIARGFGVQRAVFNKPAGLSLQDMGVKRKTFDRLRHFRAGIEGNISEWKRAFGASKATWKGYDGFHAFVWSSVLSYNLTRMVRFSSA